MSADDKAAAAWDDYVSQQQQEKIEELERQLNAANDRIKRLEEEVQELKVVNEYAWQKNGKLNDRIRHLIKLGLETSQYGLTKYREQWEQEEDL